MRYAQIDAQGICIGVSDLKGEVTAANLIAIQPDENPIGQQWDGEVWVPYAPPISSRENILNAPATGFGGPTAKELFNGNR